MRRIPKRSGAGTAADTDLPTPAQLAVEMERLSREGDAVLAEIPVSAERWAKAKRRYLRKRAQLTLTAGGAVQEKHGIEKPTVGEKDAWVTLQTTDECFEVDLAEKMMYAAWSALRLREAQLSALQTISSAVRSEIELAGRGPETRP